MDLRKKVDSLRDETVVRGGDLLRHPELGYQEIRTSGIVAEFLKKLDLPLQIGVRKTGVVARLGGKKVGRPVLVLADMDTRPIQEANEVEYASGHTTGKSEV